MAFDALLVSVFAAHHSVFAREGVKRWLARSVPERLLRSVYVWTASLLLFATCAAWQPIGGELFQRAAARVAGCTPCVQLLGVWLIVLAGARSRPARAGGHPTASRRQSTATKISD